MSGRISDFTIDCNKSAVRFHFVGIDAPNGKSKFRAKLFHRRDKLFEGGYSKKVMIANRLRCRETRVQYCLASSEAMYTHITQRKRPPSDSGGFCFERLTGQRTRGAAILPRTVELNHVAAARFAHAISGL